MQRWCCEYYYCWGSKKATEGLGREHDVVPLYYHSMRSRLVVVAAALAAGHCCCCCCCCGHRQTLPSDTHGINCPATAALRPPRPQDHAWAARPGSGTESRHTTIDLACNNHRQRTESRREGTPQRPRIRCRATSGSIHSGRGPGPRGREMYRRLRRHRTSIETASGQSRRRSKSPDRCGSE